jgi:para-nitrobenzyl esterase
MITLRGIRFATAGRFEAPVVVDDREPSTLAKCHQMPSMLDRFLGADDIVASEECLQLDVTTPAMDRARRPVMVWIHGGAFATGTAHTAWYDGAPLATRGDVVVVCVQYRLASLGFTALDGVEPNLGLLDQVAALTWVQRHIGDYGGDPANVTIFGESAGGSSVACLCEMPGAAGLFARAIAQSPSLTQIKSTEVAADVAARLRARVADPRTAPIDELLTAERAVAAELGPASVWAFTPTHGVESLPTEPGARPATVPTIVGSTTEEMALFLRLDERVGKLDDETLARRVRHRFGDNTSAAIGRYRSLTSGAPPAIAEAMATDETFTVPTLRYADALAGGDRQVPVRTYAFAWRSPMLGACHGIEIPFVFGTLDAPMVNVFTGDGEERRPLSNQMMDRWLAFASGDEPGSWGRHEPDADHTLVIDHPEVAMARHPLADRRAAFTELVATSGRP